MARKQRHRREGLSNEATNGSRIHEYDPTTIQFASSLAVIRKSCDKSQKVGISHRFPVQTSVGPRHPWRSVRIIVNLKFFGQVGSIHCPTPISYFCHNHQIKVPALSSAFSISRPTSHPQTVEQFKNSTAPKSLKTPERLFERQQPGIPKIQINRGPEYSTADFLPLHQFLPLQPWRPDRPS